MFAYLIVLTFKIVFEFELGVEQIWIRISKLTLESTCNIILNINNWYNINK